VRKVLLTKNEPTQDILLMKNTLAFYIEVLIRGKCFIASVQEKMAQFDLKILCKTIYLNEALELQILICSMMI
jgi:hypothetical protein